MKTFNEIAAEIFSLKIEEINDSLSPEDIADWDSMNYLLLIAELEKNFNMSFTMDDVISAKTLGDVHKIVNAHKPNEGN